METTGKWYTHKHTHTHTYIYTNQYVKKVLTLLCKQAVHTDTEFTANRADIIIKYKKEKTCTLIDVAIPADRNVMQKEAEKKLNARVYV
jgi:oligoribonuclease (3'-5' exoribonuclease)